MAEILSPTRLDLHEEFQRGFEGMAETTVSVEDLITTRQVLIEDIVGRMPENHRRFLISVKRGRPDWKLLDIPGVDMLPAVRWKLDNLAKLDGKRRGELVGRLGEVLKVDE